MPLFVNFASDLLANYKSNCDYHVKKTPIEVKMLQEADIQVIYRKESEKTRLVIEVLSQTHKRLRVKYADRKIFLSPFIQLLINPTKTHGLQGVRQLSRTLHLLVDFMDADGGANTLNPECIEDEIYKLYNELYPVM